MPAAIPAIIGMVAGAAAAAAAAPIFGTIIAGIIGVVVSSGVSMLAGAVLSGPLGLNKRPREGSLNAQAEAREVAVRQPVAPRTLVYGRAKVGGVLVYVASSGPQRQFLHMVSVLAGHPCQAIDSVFINDVEIGAASIGGDGFVTEGKLAGKVRIRRYLGTQTAADPDLVAESPDGWSAAHVGRGLTYLYVRLEYDRELFGAGLQNIAAVVRGKNDIADPRTGTTGYTTNWALCVLDYLRSPMGVAATADEVDTASFIAAANLSDEAVPLDAGGTLTQPRYSCDLVVSRDADRRTILRQMLTGGAGALTYVQGRYRLLGGAYTAPTASLGAGDFAGEVAVSNRAPRRDLFNAVKGTFISPDRSWQASEFPAVTDSTLEAQDGERVWRDLELPATIDPIRAQRLARIELLRGREQLTLEAPVRYAGIRFCVGQMLSVTVPDLGIAAKPMRISSWRFSPDNGAVVLRLREESAAAWAWVWEAAATLPTVPDTTLTSPLDVPPPVLLAITATTALQPDGTAAPALEVTWTPSPSAFVTAHEVQWRTVAGPGPWSSAEVPAGTNRHVIAPVLAGQALEVRLRGLAGLARSAWTPTFGGTGQPDTTAPGVPTAFGATGALRAISLAWVLPGDSDLAAVEVWENTSASAAGRYFVGETRASGFLRSGLPPNATRWYWVRSRDRTGNLSAFAGPVSATSSLLVAADIANGILDTAKFASGLAPVGLTAGVPAVRGSNPEIIADTTQNARLYRWNGTAYQPMVPTVDLSGMVAPESLPASARGFLGVDTLPAGLGPADEGRVVFLRSDDKLYRWTGTAWVASVGAGDITGQIGSDQIASLAAAKLAGQITSTQITDNAISTPKLATGAVVAAKIAAGAITASKIAVTPASLNPDPYFDDTAFWFAQPGGWAFENWAVGNAISALGLRRGVSLWGGNYGGTDARAVFSTPIALSSVGQPMRLRAVGWNFGSRPIRVAATFLDGGLNVISAISLSWSYAEGGYRSARGVVPAGTIWVQLSVSPDPGVPWTGSASAGDIQLVNAADASLIVDGAITAEKIETNAVTADKIQAGAITASKIQTDAVTADKIAAGAITAEKLAVGSSNQIWNSCLTYDTEGWVRGWSGVAAAPELKSARAGGFQVWVPTDVGGGAVELPYPAGWAFNPGEFVWAAWRPTLGVPGVPVVPGGRYHFAALLGCHRLEGYIQISWYDGGGLPTGSGVSSSIVAAGSKLGGYWDDNFARATIIATAPANARYAELQVVGRGTGVTNTTFGSYLFFTKVVWGEAPPSATEVPRWTPGGVTEISGGQLRTRTIAADRIAVNAITANELAANSVTAGKIAAGAVRAAEIAAGEIRAVHIASETIITQAAQIGSAVIGSAQIQDLSVSTLKIAGGSVSGTTHTRGFPVTAAPLGTTIALLHHWVTTSGDGRLLLITRIYGASAEPAYDGGDAGGGSNPGDGGGSGAGTGE